MFNLNILFFLAEQYLPRPNIRTSLFKDLDDTTKQRHVNVSTQYN